MHLAVYLPLLAPLLAAGSARWLSQRLDPRLATWLLTGAAVVLAAASGAALTALAATAIGQVPLLAWLGHWSVGVLRRDDPASMYLALAAGGRGDRRAGRRDPGPAPPGRGDHRRGAHGTLPARRRPARGTG